MMRNYRIYLRALELEDYKQSINWRKDEEIWSMVVGTKHFVSEAYEKKWVEDLIFNSNSKLTLAICLKDNNQHIGYVHLNDIDLKNKKANSGIMIGEREFWGEGLSKEAYILLLKHAFEEIGLERIQAHILINNIPSIKLHDACGYKHEGVLRKAIFKDGNLQDLKVMSILKDEFRDLKI